MQMVQQTASQSLRDRITHNEFLQTLKQVDRRKSWVIRSRMSHSSEWVNCGFRNSPLAALSIAWRTMAPSMISRRAASPIACSSALSTRSPSSSPSSESSVMPRRPQRRRTASTKPSSRRTYSRHISVLSALSLIPRRSSVRAAPMPSCASSCAAASTYSAGVRGCSCTARAAMRPASARAPSRCATRRYCSQSETSDLNFCSARSKIWNCRRVSA
jgi:hypothetical protein